MRRGQGRSDVWIRIAKIILNKKIIINNNNNNNMKLKNTSSTFAKLESVPGRTLPLMDYNWVPYYNQNPITICNQATGNNRYYCENFQEYLEKGVPCQGSYIDSYGAQKKFICNSYKSWTGQDQIYLEQSAGEEGASWLCDKNELDPDILAKTPPQMGWDSKEEKFVCQSSQVFAKYRCQGKTCTEDDDCGKNPYDVCYLDSQCEGICPCLQGADYGVANPCGQGYCSPNVGCVPNCAEIPGDEKGTCKLDGGGGVIENKCGVANPDDPSMDYSQCRKYFTMWNYWGAGDGDCGCWQKLDNAEDSGSVDVAGQPWPIHPSGNPDTWLPGIVTELRDSTKPGNNWVSDTATVALSRAPQNTNPDMYPDMPMYDLNECGTSETEDWQKEPYNIYSCIRDCPTGSVCNFVSTNIMSTDDSWQDNFSNHGTCYLKCPKNTPKTPLNRDTNEFCKDPSKYPHYTHTGCSPYNNFIYKTGA